MIKSETTLLADVDGVNRHDKVGIFVMPTTDLTAKVHGYFSFNSHGPTSWKRPGVDSNFCLIHIYMV